MNYLRALTVTLFLLELLPTIAVCQSITDFRISDMGPEDKEDFFSAYAAIAFNPQNNEYLVVWHGVEKRPGEAADWQIFGQRIDATTGRELGTNDFKISNDQGSQDEPVYPDVVYNSTNNEYLVVWSADPSLGTSTNSAREILGQRIDGTTGAEIGTNDFRISNMSPLFYVGKAAVAYNSVENQYLVVWEIDVNSSGTSSDPPEIYGQILDGATGSEIGSDFQISNVAYVPLRPAVAFNNLSNEYLVVWTGYGDIPGLGTYETEIFGQRLSGSTGAEIGEDDFRISDMGPDGNEEYDAESPRVAYSSSSNQYLVVWSGDDNTSPLVDNESEIYGQLIDGETGAEVGPNDFRISDMGPDGDVRYDANTPAISYHPTNNEYLVIWSGDDNTGKLLFEEFEIFGQRIDGVTGAEIGTDARISHMGPDGYNRIVAELPAVAANSSSTDYLAVYGGNDDTPPGSAFDDETYANFVGREIDEQLISCTLSAVGACKRRVKAGTVCKVKSSVTLKGQPAEGATYTLGRKGIYDKHFTDFKKPKGGTTKAAGSYTARFKVTETTYLRSTFTGPACETESIKIKVRN